MDSPSLSLSFSKPLFFNGKKRGLEVHENYFTILKVARLFITLLCASPSGIVLWGELSDRIKERTLTVQGEFMSVLLQYKEADSNLYNSKSEIIICLNNFLHDKLFFIV